MVQINFYHLLSTSIEKALPKLIEKAYFSNKKSILFLKSDKIEEFDKILWSYSTEFLPHATKNDDFKEEQFVYITDMEENPNNATILFLIDGNVPKYINNFEKCLYLFDSTNEDQLKKARNNWTLLNNNNNSLHYLQQDVNGKWQEK